jgi:hypothetical protein
MYSVKLTVLDLTFSRGIPSFSIYQLIFMEAQNDAVFSLGSTSLVAESWAVHGSPQRLSVR